MFSIDTQELADKLGDNAILTTGAAGTGVLATVWRALPAELLLFAFVSFLIIVRLVIERAWHRHAARKLALHKAREGVPPAKQRTV